MAPVAAPPRRPALRVAPSVLAAIEERLRQARGVEPCGYLLGRVTAEGAEVRRAVHGTNVHPRPGGAFLLAPEEQLAVRREGRAQALQVLGIWHGHLCGPPRPSHADLAGHPAWAPPWMLIVGRESPEGPVAVRAYWKRESRAEGADLTSWAPPRPRSLPR